MRCSLWNFGRRRKSAEDRPPRRRANVRCGCFDGLRAAIAICFPLGKVCCQVRGENWYAPSWKIRILLSNAEAVKSASAAS